MVYRMRARIWWSQSHKNCNQETQRTVPLLIPTHVGSRARVDLHHNSYTMPIHIKLRRWPLDFAAKLRLKPARAAFCDPAGSDFNPIRFQLADRE